LSRAQVSRIGRVSTVYPSSQCTTLTVAACVHEPASAMGGQTAHVALLRRLCVSERGWLFEFETVFQDGVAATIAYFGHRCALRRRGPRRIA
jgi:hypothetical protein